MRIACLRMTAQHLNDLRGSVERLHFPHGISVHDVSLAKGRRGARAPTPRRRADGRAYTLPVHA